MIGIVCLVVVAGAAALVQRAVSTSAAPGVQACDVRKLKLRVWLRAGPADVSDGYSVGSPVPCQMKKPLTLYVSLRSGDGTALPTSLAGLKDQETVSGAIGVRVAPGLPKISSSATSYSPLEDWCRVPYPQPLTLSVTAVPGPTMVATTVICRTTLIPFVDLHAMPVPSSSSKALTSGPLCVRSPSGGARLATAVGVARSLGSGQLTATAWPGDVGHLYGRLVGADAVGYVTWVPSAAPTLAGPFVIAVYPSRAAAGRAWQSLGGAQQVANHLYRLGVAPQTQPVSARRGNLIYTQLLEAGTPSENAFYYTMYKAINRCE